VKAAFWGAAEPTTLLHKLRSKDALVRNSATQCTRSLRRDILSTHTQRQHLQPVVHVKKRHIKKQQPFLITPLPAPLAQALQRIDRHSDQGAHHLAVREKLQQHVSVSFWNEEFHRFGSDARQPRS
jgi:hypothetical protein